MNEFPGGIHFWAKRCADSFYQREKGNQDTCGGNAKEMSLVVLKLTISWTKMLIFSPTNNNNATFVRIITFLKLTFF